MEKNSIDRSITPSAVRRTIKKHFATSRSSDIIAGVESVRARLVNPQTNPQKPSLSRRATETSWRCMLSETGKTRATEVADYALDLLKDLDLTTAYLSGSDSHVSLQSVPREARRMLVSPRSESAPKLLSALVESSTYKQIRKRLQTLALANEDASPECDDLRQFFAHLAVVLEQAEL